MGWRGEEQECANVFPGGQNGFLQNYPPELGRVRARAHTWTYKGSD